jgi:asparagine synthetase B (glutamine-hydrolysing)
MLCALEHRGNHATGIALLNPDGVHITKNCTPAWSFVGEKETRDFLDQFLTPETSMALLHTRFATVGNPKEIVNNHPMWRGKTAVVHNGGINNHAALFAEHKMERSCETDSDVIRGICDTYGITAKGISVLGKMSGSAAIAAFSTENPDHLLLARSGSPLIYGLVEDKMWWASTMGAIQKATRPWVNLHGLWGRKTKSDVAYFTMPDNTAYILSQNGVEYRTDFKVCLHYTAPTYAGVHTSYHSRMTSFTKEKERTDKRRIAASKPVLALPSSLPLRAASHPLPIVTITNGKKFALCPYCARTNNIPVADLWEAYICGSTTCARNLAVLDPKSGK